MKVLLYFIFKPFEYKNIIKIIKYFPSFKEKSPSSECQRAGFSRLPRQNDYRTFCMSEETEKVYQELKEVIELLS